MYEKSQNKLSDFAEDTSIACRKRKRTKPTLSKSEMLDIVYDVLIEHKKVNMVAKEYRVGFNTVTVLISKARKNPKFIAELFS